MVLLPIAMLMLVLLFYRRCACDIAEEAAASEMKASRVAQPADSQSESLSPEPRDPMGGSDGFRATFGRKINKHR